MPRGKRKSSSSPGARLPAPAAPKLSPPCSGAPRFVACPTCGKSFALAFVQDHAWNCGGTIDSCHEEEATVVKRCSLQQGGNKNLHKFVECPTCGESFPQHAIEHHAWGCQPQRQQRHDKKEDGTTTAAAAVSVKGCKQEPARCLANAESEYPVKYDVSKATATERAPGWQTETSSQLKSRHITGSRPVCTFSAEGRLVTTVTATVPSPETKLSQGACGRESGDRPREHFPDGQPQDVVQKLMEGGKRAVELEKQSKIVPRNWPVELVLDILPKEEADSLLVCLLDVSRQWTSHPWFNNNGVEGRSHSRSQIYRLPANRDGNNTTTTHNPSRSQCLSHARPTEATQMTKSAPHRKLLQATVGNDFGGGACSTAGRTRERRRERQKKTQDAVALVESSSDDESFEYDIFGAAADDRIAAPQDYAVSASKHGDSSGQVSTGGAGSGGTMSGSAVTKGESVGAASRRDRRATYEEMMLGENSDVAPAELLEIVPRVVEAVRSRQRQRVVEGLGGAEGLHWTPNFCICHVYDDHRSHIGAHSDTLSNIGPQAIVAGVSLGAKRVFVVEETLPWGTKSPPARDLSGGGKKRIDMLHNSAVVMWGGCQERYKHSVPALPKGVGIHPIAGTKRISITFRERKETLPRYLLPIPDCRCGVPATLKARVLTSGGVEYFFQCDRGQGQCGFMQPKARARDGRQP